MFHIFLIHSSLIGHLSCFHVLALVNSAATNLGVHVSSSMKVLSGYMPRSGIAGLYVSSILSFLEYCQTVFNSGCINLYSTNSAGGFPLLHTLSSISILTSMRWHLIVVLICNSLIISDFEHFLKCACWPSICLIWRNDCLILLPVFLSFFPFLLFRATPVARGCSQSRGQIGAVAAGLCHSYSNAGSEPHL